MPKHFLITGLPRSRTAWMAAFMSYGSTVCLHEPRNWESVFDSDGPKFVGISDSGLGFQLDRILYEYACPALIIDRPLADVEASLKALDTGLPKTNFCELLKNKLSEFPASTQVMRVPYAALNDMRVMQKIFFHLTPGEPFDEGRFHSMKDMNIQCDVVEKYRNPSLHYKIPKVDIIS